VKSSDAENRLSQKTHFGSRFKRITPSSSPARNISLSFYQNLCFSASRPVSHEGRFAVVTDVEAGCGGRIAVAAWLIPTPTNSTMRTVKSRGPDTPTLVSALMRKHHALMVAKKPGAPGRTRSSR
jgi:hypothetical protein